MKIGLKYLIGLMLFLFSTNQTWAESASSDTDHHVQVIYVDADATGKNTGTSWKNAFVSLQSALDEAALISGPKEIWVANGTYVPTKVDVDPTRSITPTFLIPDLTKIFGGFRGNEKHVCQRKIKAPGKTILSGLSTPQANHVVTLDNVSVVIDGIQIRDGLAQNGAGFTNRESGGGIFIYSGNTLLDHVSIISNEARSSANAGGTGLGGGIFANRRLATDAPPVITMKHVLIDSNLANRFGGGMFFAIATVDMDHSLVQNNQAIRLVANFGQGGGMQLSEGIANITNSTFQNNRATNFQGLFGLGGAIYNFGTNVSTVILKDCKIKNNTSNSQGGGLYNSGGRMVLTNTLIEGNICQPDTGTLVGTGGGLRNFGEMTIVGCIIKDNFAGNSSGGFENTQSTALISNSHIIGNSAGIRAGGILNAANLTVNNSIIENNSAPGTGGGISTAVFVADPLTTVLYMTDCKVRSNTASMGAGVSNVATATIENCTIENNHAPIDAEGANGIGAGLRIGTVIGTTETSAGLCILRNCIVKDNRADVQGGGIFADQNTTLSIEDCLLCSNSADQDGGGAIYATSAFVTATQNQFINNKAANGGAIFYTNVLTTPFTANILDNKFYKNSASITGGAIAVANSSNADTNIFNNLFCKNKSPQGRAISAINASVDIVDNSFKKCKDDCCIYYENANINDKTDPRDIDEYLRFLNSCNQCK